MITEIHKSKQPRRPHFIREWAELRGYARQVDLAEALGADKSIVSNWYTGTSPTTGYQEKLAALFDCDPESLFRHPDDDWLAKLFKDNAIREIFKNRTPDELRRMFETLKTAFPKKDGTNG